MIYFQERGDFVEHLLAAYNKVEVKIAAGMSSLTERTINLAFQSSMAQLGVSSPMYSQFKFLVLRNQGDGMNTTTSKSINNHSMNEKDFINIDYPFHAFRSIGAGGVTPGISRPSESGGGIQVELSLEVEWPLCLVITKRQCSMYSHVFHMRAHIRRVLSRACALYPSFRTGFGGGDVFRGRWAIVHTLRELQGYLMDESNIFLNHLMSQFQLPAVSSVMETNYGKSKSCLDLRDLAQLHDEFITKIEMLHFLVPAARLLRECLMRLLDVAERFCAASERLIADAHNRAQQHNHYSWKSKGIGVHEEPSEARVPPGRVSGGYGMVRDASASSIEVHRLHEVYVTVVNVTP
jgi:hypothetical protein